MHVCPKCSGDGYRSRQVAALGPIRPGGITYTVDNRPLPYVPKGKMGTAHVVNKCHVCGGKGTVAK